MPKPHATGANGGSELSDTSRVLGLSEGLQLEFLKALPPGEYSVEYHDSTHLKEGQWFTLAVVGVKRPRRFGEAVDQVDVPSPWYEVAARVQLPRGDAELDERERRRLERVVEDQLAQALVRAGLLRPSMTARTFQEVQELSQRQAVIVVPDTNALCNGTLHWLARSLMRTQLWVMTTALSLTHVQQHESWLQDLVRQPTSLSHLRRALRWRTVVNASLSLLHRLRERYQVVGVAPSLLRYVRPSGRASGDPDQGDVLEDRLLVEAVHSVLRPARTRTPHRVLTSDITLARVLRSEAIPTLCMQVPRLGDNPIPCLRFEPVGGGSFQGAPLSQLLWELAHTFASVRLVDDRRQTLIRLDAYWDGKTEEDWEEERLRVTELAVPQYSRVFPAAELPVELTVAAAGDAVGVPLSRAAVPEVSLVQVLRLGGALMSGPGSLEQLAERMPGTDKPGRDLLRMAADVLVRAGLAVHESDGRLVARPLLSQLDEALGRGDLDEASRLFGAYRPYRVVLDLLREHGHLERAAARDALRDRLGNPSKEAVERLLRFPVYFAQAWTDGRVIRDGSERPNDDELVAGFLEGFSRTAREGLAAVEHLLLSLCRALRISPWVAARRIEELAEKGLLQEFTFQSAAGRPVRRADEVIRGSLRSIQVEPVALDRLHVRGVPVFTISRRQP